MSTSSSYPSTSVRAIIRRGDKVLVEWLESKEIAFLPGGTVEGNEDLLDALRRELNEEIQGAACIIGAYRGSIGHWWTFEGRQEGCLNHYYEVELDSNGEISAQEPGRCLTWVSLQGEDSLCLQPPRLRDVLRETQAALWNYVDVSE